MKHAGAAALDRLDPLVADVRDLPGLRETSRGVFYRKGRAFLHFHEDPEGLFADLRNAAGADFDRFDVSDPVGQADLLAAASARLTA